MSQMSGISAAGAGSSPNGMLSMGAGFHGGQKAISIGYGKSIGERAVFTLGGAFSGSERSAGFGFGVKL